MRVQNSIKPDLHTLCVVHRTKNSSHCAELPLFTPAQVLKVETCLREVWIGFERPQHGSSELAHHVILQGADAYEFLLRLSSGLESEILGETEIFGQIKAAFLNFRPQMEKLSSELRRAFDRLSQNLFEDTKEIRSRYFQGSGSQSYGSLARRLLPAQTDEGSILMVGAGQLAESIWPYFSQRPLKVWNRTADKLPRHLHRILSPSDLEQAWIASEHAILCIPPHHEQERHWLSLWEFGRSQGVRKGKILHFGDKSSREGMISLSDIFEIDRAQNELRQHSAKKAEHFCRERTQLRMLGSSLSLAHGWEDLAAFHGYS